MSQNTFDQCNDLMTRIAAADGTVAAAHAPELLDTELAREVLEAIVGGQVTAEERYSVINAWPKKYTG